MTGTHRTLGRELSEVVAHLEASLFPQLDSRVFGSAVTRPADAFDLDVGIVLNEPFVDDRQLIPFRRLLHVANRGQPLYGRLDLFLSFPNALLVRDDDCRGFVRAKQAKALRQALTNGTPWEVWRATVALNPHLSSPAGDANEPAPKRNAGPRR